MIPCIGLSVHAHLVLNMQLRFNKTMAAQNALVEPHCGRGKGEGGPGASPGPAPVKKAKKTEPQKIFVEVVQNPGLSGGRARPGGGLGPLQKKFTVRL